MRAMETRNSFRCRTGPAKGLDGQGPLATHFGSCSLPTVLLKIPG